ncbi:helix-turn-helix transcriptional regulator [Erysipelothrix rhusiopathiae]|nr:helix-turn-helix transcriptional regulator [Erysipelothrix rhusiopathiae]
MATFSNRFKELRLSKKLTQKQIAKIFGLAESTISMYESGKREPNFDQLDEFADYFNVDLNYLLGQSNVTTNIEKGIHGKLRDDLEYFASKPELLELCKTINEQKQLQQLFRISKDLSPIDLETVLMVAKGIKKERDQD